jgi:lipopolysaccharide biosynthesis regulator YciM
MPFPLRSTRGFMLLPTRRAFRFVIPIVFVAMFPVSPTGLAQIRKTTAITGSQTLTITTESNAIVWIDEIRRGVTDASGKLTLTKVSPGRHTLRMRAHGFKESTVMFLPGRSGNVAVRLVRTTDEAELAFQEAETAREQAKDDASGQKVVEIYRLALKLRSAFPAAHVGLARVLLDLNQYEQALAEIEAARRSRPIYPEASAVEGRIYRESAFTEEAIRSFRRAIREGRGFQPEAHVGLARVLEEKAEYSEATAEYRKAIEQLSDSEPVIYQLLGAAYEKQQKYREALGAYEKYLRLAPNSSLAPAVHSIIDQLRRDASGQESIPCCE